MSPIKPAILVLLIAVLFSLVSCSGNDSSRDSSVYSTNPKINKLKLPDGFRAEHLYGPSENEQGSWVSMAFDDKGRMLASDQYGSIYRMEFPPIGTDSIPSKVKIEKLQFDITDANPDKLEVGYAHGLLWAFNSLYVMINHYGDSAFPKSSGFYRLQDTDGDDQFDQVTLLKALQGDGEHGPHSVVLAPDKKSIYVIAGNFTAIPEMNAYRRLPDWGHDNIIPLIKDPNGHDNVVHTHGGWIAKVDSSGSHWELVSSGFRNPFDLAFNDAGDMFTYDSDMEWDFGLPWYRPTRILHVTSGAEYGWRPGTGKWSADYPDNMPAMINVGQGSPTNLFYGANARFPEKYRKSLFAFDWSFGIIYAIQPTPEGATYTATGEEFLSGSPLPLTDGVIGPDGAMYFMTGGRRLESDVYRVYYAGDDDVEKGIAATTLNEAHNIRRQLETYHGEARTGAMDYIWPHLKHGDRFIRYAARVALEHQPVAEWQERALKETDPVILTETSIALARHGDKSIKNRLLGGQMTVSYSQLSEEQQLNFLRAIELVFARMGQPGPVEKAALADYLNRHYPAQSNKLNRELSKLMAFIEAPGTVKKTMALLETAKDDAGTDKLLMESSDLILRNPQYGLDIAGMLARVPPLQQTHYATVLSAVKNGWTDSLKEDYFKWYAKAFQYKGGYSFPGFINGARKTALQNISGKRFAHYNSISGDSLVGRSGNALVDAAMKPKRPGRNWTLEDAVAVADSGIAGRDFERGKAMFAASLCISCHNVRGEGGMSGPDLTQLGTRFSYKDMLEAIIEPDKAISDQYGSTIFHLKAGGSVLGRLVTQDDIRYVIAQNPFAPQVTREVLKSDVSRTSTSTVSPMLPGLINRLNPEELKDLLAFLKSGGNKEDTIFNKK